MPPRSKLPIDVLLAFVFGVVFVTALLTLAVLFSEPTPFQYTVFRIVLALAAAGVAAVIPGILNVNSALSHFGQVVGKDFSSPFETSS